MYLMGQRVVGDKQFLRNTERSMYFMRMRISAHLTKSHDHYPHLYARRKSFVWLEFHLKKATNAITEYRIQAGTINDMFPYGWVLKGKKASQKRYEVLDQQSDIEFHFG